MGSVDPYRNPAVEEEHLRREAANAAKLFADIASKRDSAVFENTVRTIASKVESRESMQRAGALVIREVAATAGGLDTYINALKHRLSPRLLAFVDAHRREIVEILERYDYLNYYDHDFFSASTFVKTYLLRPSFGENPCESPLLLYLRVAIHLYAEQGVRKVFRAFLQMARHKYTHATPTLLNAGTKCSQGSSCFLATMGDSLESIFETIHRLAMISKACGGVGIDVSQLRHSEIANSGMSSGVIPVLRILDKLVSYVDQGGKRSGAGTAYLGDWHKDLWEFVNATNNFGQSHSLRLANLNTAVWVHDLFMRRVIADETWTVFCPAKADLYGRYGEEFETAYLHYEKLAAQKEEEFRCAEKTKEDAKVAYMASPGDAAAEAAYLAAMEAKREASKARIDHSTRKAREFFNHIVDLETKSGFPYVMYGDSINDKSNQANIGRVNSSNLCTEIVEVSTTDTIASCNLASISLKAFARGPFPIGKLRGDESPDEIVAMMASSGCYDFDGLGRAVRAVVENLDSVIEHNFYPVENTTRDLNLTTRPLGIGVSGFSDAVAILDAIFESPVAEALNKAIFACMYFNALAQSTRLARANGPYGRFRDGEFTLPRAVDSPPPRGSRAPIAAAPSSFPGVVNETFAGSPAANGFFQFDLWQRRARVLEARGLLYESVYRSSDDVPIAPSSWGQPMLDLTTLIEPGDEDDVNAPFDSDADSGVGGNDILMPSWSDLRKQITTRGLRHSMLLTVMPTASSAQILRNAESTEVHSANLYTRTLMTGRFSVVNQHLVADLEALGLWNARTLEYLTCFAGTMKYFEKFVADFPNDYPHFRATTHTLARLQYVVQKYRTMFEVSQKTILRYARQRGPYVCQTQSTNLFVENITLQKLYAMHIFGWQLGLKTGLYYLRQKPAIEGSNFTQSAEMLEYVRAAVNGPEPAATLPPAVAPAGAACTLEMRKNGDCLSCGS